MRGGRRSRRRRKRRLGAQLDERLRRSSEHMCSCAVSAVGLGLERDRCTCCKMVMRKSGPGSEKNREPAAASARAAPRGRPAELHVRNRVQLCKFDHLTCQCHLVTRAALPPPPLLPRPLPLASRLAPRPQYNSLQMGVAARSLGRLMCSCVCCVCMGSSDGERGRRA